MEGIPAPSGGDSRFAHARTTGEQKINGKDSYVVEARSAEGERRQVYFDVGTGLLIRI